MAVNPVNQERNKDGRLYVWVAACIPIIVLIGFARTYYLKPVFGAQALPSFLVHLHGAVMTSWVLLFIAQVWLIASRRTRVHQRLGVVGAILALLVVVVGVATALVAAARDSASGPEPLRFLIIPLVDMLIFAVLIAVALYYRRRMEIHKRLMLLAALSLLTPAIARIPLHFIETGGPMTPFALTDACILACVAFDVVKHRGLHLAFLWGTLLIVVSQPLRIMLGNTEAWLRLASWLMS
jgi:uncharacterized membrane protein